MAAHSEFPKKSNNGDMQMNDWQKKLDIFLSNFEHINDTVGILVCGSYITGNPTNHSDLDVHIILDNNAPYRERGNKIIDGLLIEYFANPYKQILCYFDEDLRDKSLMSQTQFATGKIMLDKAGDVEALKAKAKAMISDFYASRQTSMQMSDMDKYFLWDMLDDLQDAYETQRPDFDLMYFTSLNMMLETYMRCINFPYHRKTIYGNIVDAITREKYLLQELPNADINNLIIRAITAAQKADKMDIYEELTAEIICEFGGFNIDGFKLKSDVEG